jgi:S-disulfanyl-L-cysteine oxidoreductase SoxD
VPLRENIVSRSRVLILWLLLSLAAAAASRSVWDGVYTKEQASRGRTVYGEECMKCHGENLMGAEAGPALAGDEFLPKWNGKTVGDLFQNIRKTMPSDDPGHLSTRQYSDVVAYILSANGFPIGQKDLDREMIPLNEIRIETKR